MRTNKLTMGSNLKWEGSRMMLPEHRECLLERRRDQRKHPKPELDDDELTIINQAISMSRHDKSEITLTVYDPYEDQQLVGYVVRVDQHRGRVLIQTADSDEWVELCNVISADY